MTLKGCFLGQRITEMKKGEKNKQNKGITKDGKKKGRM